jgi:DNA polymerase-3 subunit delta
MLALQRFEEQIKKGLPEKIYFLFATEPFFLLEAVRLLRKHFNSIAIQSFDSPEEINTTTLMSPFSLFAEKKVVVVYHFEKIKKTETRLKWLSKVLATLKPPLTLIVLSNSPSKEIEQEIELLKKNRLSIFNLDIEETKLHQWIQYKAKESGVNLTTDAVFYLMQVTNNQPGLIASEIEKIALLTDEPEISSLHIKNLLSDIAEYKAFDLVSAVERKLTSKAFKIIKQIKYTDYDLILGALNWFYSNNQSGDNEVFRLLYKSNLSLRQAKLCSLELLLYELLKR